MNNSYVPHILVVEDENSLARYLQLELNHEGFQVETAQNSYLRAKIDEPFSVQLLHTIRGIGYSLRGE